ncbi:hypothetical protein ACWEQL_34055 [Kitasatospora sp. NPDC004240]
MTHIQVPDPEPDWQPAAVPPYYTGKNPATQFSLWQVALGSFRMIAGLEPPLEALAARLVMQVERSWEDLGEVDTAFFRIERLDFALSRLTYNQAETWVWLDRRHEDPEAALGILLNALGLGWEAVVFTGGPDSGFHYLDHGRQPS